MGGFVALGFISPVFNVMRDIAIIFASIKLIQALNIYINNHRI